MVFKRRGETLLNPELVCVRRSIGVLARLAEANLASVIICAH